VSKLAGYFPHIFVIILLFSSCSSTNTIASKYGSSRFLSVEQKFAHYPPETRNIQSLPFSHESKVIIWLHGTKRPAVISNHKCNDDLPPKSLMLAANKLDFSVYYLCSTATDGVEKGSFIYKRVSELEKLLSQLNEVGIHNENIFLAGFSAGGWTALMAARALPNRFNRGVLFAPAFAGPRYETNIFPIWRKVLRPKQINEILEAERLNFLIFAYSDDPFNRPEDLNVFLKSNNFYPKIIGYSCKKGHFTYRKDCKSNETYKEILNFFQASDS
jgi:hypothetical protein